MIKSLKILILTLSFLNTSIALSKGFTVKKINFDCYESKKDKCEEVKSSLETLKRSYSNMNHFYTVIKIFLGNEGVKHLNFKLTKDQNLVTLHLRLKLKKIIAEVKDYVFDHENSIEFPSILPIQEGEFLDPKKIEETKKLVKDVSVSQGYPQAKVSIKKNNTKDGVELIPQIKLGEPLLLKNVTVNSQSIHLNQNIQKELTPFINIPLHLQEVKLSLEELRKLYIDYGYYLLDFNLKVFKENDRFVNIVIEISNVERYAFYIDNLPPKEIKDIKDNLSENLISSRREMTIESIEFYLKEFYETRGFKFPNFKVKRTKFIDKNKDTVRVYKIYVDKNIQSQLSNLQFKGNSFYNDTELTNLYYKNAYSLASLNIYDFKYYEAFRTIIKEKYIADGYLGVVIEDPVVQFESNSKRVRVTFKIREGIRTTISKFNIEGVTAKEESEIKKLMSNKVSEPFNPISFGEDIDKVTKYLKSRGHYFSRIENTSKDDYVRYFADNSQVDLVIKVYKGPKITVDQILIIGNKRTRKKLILRELSINEGDLLTNESISRSQSNLLRLGIFSTVNIKPVSDINDKTDILIFVREKDFGLIEVAPGIRSDLGLKFSTLVSYNNLDGMNKRITFQGTVNRRFDLNLLDDQRRQSNKQLFEYDTSINFLESHIFNTQMDFTLSGSLARRRFVSYDADIKRVSYTFSSDIASWLSVSLKQQLEVVSQFNATNEDNEGHFQIGSFTPGFNLNFKDRDVSPRSGAEFDFSLEIANPFFLSQENDELTINYYKFMNRNKFYVPVNDKVVFAMSAALGVQENLAREQDYIPGIKVFRLTGADIVRGFLDEEMNRIVGGEDINNVQINSKAYLANIKIEPRYYLSDSTLIGLFYDAGRIFVDEFSVNDLRSSYGISFKYVTPIGTLDLDYGIKTLRKRDSGGNFEVPGNLHLSIGFF